MVAVPLMLAVLGAWAHAAGAQSTRPLCGSGGAVHGNAAMILHVLNGPADLHSPYVSVTARNGDGSHLFTVSYRPTEAGLGKPHMVHVDTLAHFANEAEVRPLRLEWRVPGGRWSTQIMWSTPQRHFPAEEPRYRANYRLGQGAPFPHGTEVLDFLAAGGVLEFRSLDEVGSVVSSGTADYPPQPAIDAMYAEARRAAMSRLRPCSTDRPPAIAPAAPLRPAN